MARIAKLQRRQIRVKTKDSEVESVEENQGQSDEVRDDREAVIESVSSGQGVTCLELVKNKVHPPSPLDVFALLVAILQLGPDVVEVVEQLLGLVAAPVDGYGEQAREDEREADQEVMEAGVRSGQHVILTLSVLIRPVQRTAGIGS